MRFLIQFALVAACYVAIAGNAKAGCPTNDVVLKESKALPNWFNHKLSEHPIFVLDNNSASTCAAFWKPGDGWSYIETAHAYKTSGPYDYIEIFDPLFRKIGYGDEKNGSVRTELQSILQANGLNHAMIWVWGSGEPDLSDPRT
jgi:hypothetical protein